MAAQKHETAPESMAPVEKGAVRRRGLIAGAAALAAGLLAARMGNELSRRSRRRKHHHWGHRERE